MHKHCKARSQRLLGQIYGKYFLLICACALPLLNGCHTVPADPNTVTVLIESSPTSLDPRVGVDAQSEHIDMLLFDSLVRKDTHFNLQPDLATSWTIADPRMYIFHLRSGVVFHNGQPLTARDVKWTLDTIRNGTLITAKSGALRSIASVETPDAHTVILHLKYPDAALLWNLSDGAVGIVPYGSGRDFQQHPIGTGPFRFVQQEIDKEVVLERNPASWEGVPHIHRVRFEVVPDAMTRALELRKGSADIAVNAFPADMVWSLRHDPQLIATSIPGTEVQYLTLNLRDPYLHDVRVRQAIAYAINRPLIIQALLRGQARPASSLLPPNHWAYQGYDPDYSYDPAHARQLLDQAGYTPKKSGIRFHLSMKTSTDETARLLAIVLQQQLRQVGISLDVQSYEFATFYSDISRGVFGMYSLRWIGGNEDPDIFRYAFATSSAPPHGANRGFYTNAEVDALIVQAQQEVDQKARRSAYVQVQKILSHDLPAIPLWYINSVIVYNRRFSNVQPSPSGTFDFLRDISLRTP
ncbi:MAG TPA: ABC transporter substrate-binding protein [Acidobacteriaceae bacterium]|jgi:peptide/nickel transport system substrate-binding protein|nr:ABC transporter substrate-binding protein [Acidobacteriaceae bacterium]